MLNLCHFKWFLCQPWLLAQADKYLPDTSWPNSLASTITYSYSMVNRLNSFQFFQCAKLSISSPRLCTWTNYNHCYWSIIFSIHFFLYSFFQCLPRYFFLLKVFQSQILFFINVGQCGQFCSGSPHFWPGSNVSDLHCNLRCLLLMPHSFLPSLQHTRAVSSAQACRDSHASGSCITCMRPTIIKG